MIRPALVTLALAFAVLPAAASAANHYRAEPAAAPAQARFIARENVWNCSAGACTSGRSSSRPAIVCATLVREVGSLRSFSVEGRAFAAEELESCNRRAR